jgi:transcriptional regulator with PAS, ATPase and Fis domain
MSMAPEPEGGAGRMPYLFVVLEAGRPLQPPLRLPLRGVDEVTIGRGAAGVKRSGAKLALTVDDRLASSSHARLTRVHHSWMLEDLGSKNGTVVDGAPAERMELRDGAIFEVGQTFFSFRAALPALEGPFTPGAPAAPLLSTVLPSLQQAFADLERVARSTVSVVLEGETGTGKEVVARAVHALSGRGGPFVAVNCGAIAPTLVETELFGYKKGAFSGAADDRPGLVRAADGGTLFLDEIGDLPKPAQAAFLRVLQEREVMPVGATKAISVDVRLVSAMHGAIEKLVDAGSFRPDLATRIAGHKLVLPPLRQRREDLGLVIAQLVRRLAPSPESVKFAPRAARALVRGEWPGNVRELEKVLAAALVLAPDGNVALAHLPEPVRAWADALPPTPVAALFAAAESPRMAALADEVEALEKSRMADALAAEHGNQTRAAERIGMPLRTFQKKLKRYDLK